MSAGVRQPRSCYLQAILSDIKPRMQQQDGELKKDSQEADASYEPRDARVQVALIVDLGRVGDLHRHDKHQTGSSPSMGL